MTLWMIDQCQIGPLVKYRRNKQTHKLTIKQTNKLTNSCHICRNGIRLS